LKKLFLTLYTLTGWLIIGIIVLSISLFFVVESPSTVLSLVKTSLKEQGIYYGEIEGGLLSGFVLKDVNYQDKVKAKEVRLKVDLKQLENRVLYIDNVIVDNVEVEQNFLASFIDINSTEDVNKSSEKVDLPFDRVIVNNADISLHNTRYQTYYVDDAKLHIDKLDTDMEEKHKGKVTFFLKSNITQLNLHAEFKNKTYKLHANIEGEKSFLAPFVAEQNITFLSNPKLTLDAKGDLETLEYKLTTQRLAIQQNQYRVASKVLKAFGRYNIQKNDVEGTLKTQLNANVAKLTLDAHAKLNLDDVNNSLVFNADMKFQPKETLIKNELKEQNMSIDALPLLSLVAKGDMKKVDFSTTIEGLKAKQNERSLDLKVLDINGSSKPLQGDTKLTAHTRFNSSVADGEVHLNTALNFNDLNNTLTFDTQAKLDAHALYINPFLKDANLVLQGETPITLKAVGNMEKLTVNLNAHSMLLKDNIVAKATLKSEPIVVNVKMHQVKGALSVNADSKNMDLKLNTHFEGDYTQADKMETNTQVRLNHFDAFGVNLASLTPLTLYAKSNTKGMRLNVDSKKINMKVKSHDYNQFTFDLKTGKIYPYKIVELPEELKNKFLKLDLEGNAKRSKEYFSLQGFLESNKQFKVDVHAHNNHRGLQVNLNSKHLKAEAKGHLESKNIQATVKIDSLKKLQEELMALYPFSAVPVDGSLSMNAGVKGEEVLLTLNSSKLKLDGFNVEQLQIDGDYKQELLTLNTLKFKTTGFQDKRLNRAFYLNQKGKIYLGKKRDIFLDIHPKILIKAKGTAENLQGDFTIESLPLGYPSYGSTVLSSQVHYEQFGTKKKIVGGISLEKLKLSYESKFLDVAHDPDVVVITKKDKKKKKKHDSFLEDTSIDLAIYAPDAQYKTRDIDLEFTVDVKAKKEFGKNLGMLGKVREIQGRVEQAPKLFKVVDSNIVFRGTKEINPLLDIQVEHELPEVLININIHGDANHPKLDFSSDPLMPKKDILSYLLFGVSTANLAAGEGSLGREAQLFIMNQAARDFAYEVGLDRVFIKDDGTGEGYAVQVGKKVKENTMFVIENSKEGNSYILEYDVNKNIKVELGQHQKTVPSQSIDIFFKKKFK